MVQDLRFACRIIASDRWFCAAIVVALALGIGANAAGFTIINAAFFRGLPFEESSRLYVVSWQTRAGRRAALSHLELQDLRTGTRAFIGLAAFRADAINVSDDVALPQRARGAWMTANAFDVLRQPPALGRGLTAADDRPGAEPVVIISHKLWIARYGGDAAVIGKAIRLNGRPSTVIGVMPPAMGFPENTEVWAPLVPTADQQRRDARVLTVFGRLNGDTGRRTAAREADDVAAQLMAAHANLYKDILGARVETFTERFVGGPGRTMFIAMMGAVGFVLLIAIANVANLLLSRSASRAREIAMRMALGATRLRVVRQLLIESVVLSVIGGGLGLLLAVAGVRWFDAAVQDAGKPYWIAFTVDYAVLAYVAALCIATAVLCGLLPALNVSTRSNGDALKEDGRGMTSHPRLRRFSHAMVVAELAMTVVLLAGAGLMIRSFLNLEAAGHGIAADNLLTMRLQLQESAYPTAEARRAFFERLELRLGATAGLRGIAVTTAVPPNNDEESAIEVAGRAATRDRPRFVSLVTISPSFFAVINQPLLRGRGFTASDGAPGAEHVIINERLAAQFFAGEDPIGQQIRFAAGSPWHTIAGVSPSIRHSSPQDIESDPVVYLPYRHSPRAAAWLLVRSELPPASVMDEVRRAVQSIDPDQPVFTIQTLDQMLAERRWPYRAFGGAFAVFALIALLLSSVGLYALVSYSVTRRTAEIGVRMAVGAQARQVLWMVLRQGLAQLAIGLVVGLAGAVALSQVLQRMLVQVSPGDPVTLVAISAILAAVSIVACLSPALRASRLDPLAAMRGGVPAARTVRGGVP